MAMVPYNGNHFVILDPMTTIEFFFSLVAGRGPFKGPRVGSQVTLGNELYKERHV